MNPLMSWYVCRQHRVFFKDGAQAVNGFLAEQKFADTSVQHILSPSSSKDVGLGGRNTTSVKDCAELLSRIYKGECVSKEASEAMLNLLLNQQVTTKIPQRDICVRGNCK